MCCCRGGLHCLLLEPGSSLIHSLCRDARAEPLPQCISGDTIIRRLCEDSKGMRQPRSDSHKPLATVPNEFFPHIWPKCFGFCHLVFRGKRKKHKFSIQSKCCLVKRKLNRTSREFWQRFSNQWSGRMEGAEMMVTQAVSPLALAAKQEGAVEDLGNLHSSTALFRRAWPLLLWRPCSTFSALLTKGPQQRNERIPLGAWNLEKGGSAGQEFLPEKIKCWYSNLLLSSFMCVFFLFVVLIQQQSSSHCNL